MSKTIILSSLVLASFLSSFQASAIPVTLTDTTVFTAAGAVDSVSGQNDLNGFGSGDVNYLKTSLKDALSGHFDYVSWTHQYSFDPALDYVISGSLSLNFRDNDVDAGLLSQEYAFGFAEDGTWALGEVDSASYNFDVKASFLDDGLFSVTVASLLGDFYLDSSTLTVIYEPLASAVNVPEPSTLVVMGAGLILIGLFHGTRRNKPNLHKIA